MLKNGELFLDNQQDIENHVLAYYESLYASENTRSDSDFVQKAIPKIVTRADNPLLTNPPSFNESRKQFLI